MPRGVGRPLCAVSLVQDHVAVTLYSKSPVTIVERMVFVIFARRIALGPIGGALEGTRFSRLSLSDGNLVGMYFCFVRFHVGMFLGIRIRDSNGFANLLYFDEFDVSTRIDCEKTLVARIQICIRFYYKAIALHAT